MIEQDRQRIKCTVTVIPNLTRRAFEFSIVEDGLAGCILLGADAPENMDGGPFAAFRRPGSKGLISIMHQHNLTRTQVHAPEGGLNAP